MKSIIIGEFLIENINHKFESKFEYYNLIPLNDETSKTLIEINTKLNFAIIVI